MRMLHTMLRVGNLERSLKFYTEVLGMQVLRQHDYPDGKFTLAFVGYGAEKDHTVLELTYNYGVESYDMGKALSLIHIFKHHGCGVTTALRHHMYVIALAPNL